MVKRCLGVHVVALGGYHVIPCLTSLLVCSEVGSKESSYSSSQQCRARPLDSRKWTDRTPQLTGSVSKIYSEFRCHTWTDFLRVGYFAYQHMDLDRSK